MNAFSGPGSVSTSDRPHRSRCTAPGMCPVAKSSAGRTSMTSGLRSAFSAASRACGVASSCGLAYAVMASFYSARLALDARVFTRQSIGVDVTRALDQIAEIHAHIAKGEVYRGYRSLPIAASGAIGIVAAWLQPVEVARDPIAFAIYWICVALTAMLVGSSEIL